MLKQIDRLLLKSFFPLFVLTFLIALFVLVMQFLWLNIDDIAGKGAGFALVLQVLFYHSIFLIPLALPIAMIISSVMVYGNLAEHQELTIMKTAGVSLFRMMRPLLIVSILIAGFSLFCSNNLVPFANFQAKTLFLDIQKNKPTLNLEVQAFNDDFKDFTIYIGGKEQDNRTILDVIIYDQSSINQTRSNILTANKGEMFTSHDGRFFVMKLYNGTQYRENKQANNNKPYTRTHFEEWTKVFDLAEFEINHGDPNRFKAHHFMLSIPQLMTAIDSIDSQINNRKEELSTYSKSQFHLNRPSADHYQSNLNTSPKKRAEVQSPGLNHFYDNQGTMAKAKNFHRVKASVRNIINQSDSVIDKIHVKEEKKVKYLYQLHLKFSNALICIIFLLIGAPMGAIVRKGGFGYPLLIAISFFMLYIVLNALNKKLAESFILNPVLAAWMSNIILLPLSLLLSYKTMKDEQLFDLNRFRNWVNSTFKKRLSI